MKNCWPMLLLILFLAVFWGGVGATLHFTGNLDWFYDLAKAALNSAK